MTDLQQGIFGIDLGTTYSVVAYIDESGRPAVARNSYGEDTTPSVVFFETPENVVVGAVAKAAAAQDPDQVVSLIKREMGDKEYRRTFFGVEHTPPSISAIILEALARIAETDTHQTVRDVVITVPAYFGLLEKDATRKAGEIAGLNVIGIVPEPVAAALHYGVNGRADGTTVLVYDLGGGTFDVTLIRLTEEAVEVLAVDGDHRLGGADWDEKLYEHIVSETAAQTGDEAFLDDEALLQDLRALAEKTKKELSAAESRPIIVRYTGTPAKFSVTRSQFESLTADLLDETLRITERMLTTAEQQHPGIRNQIDEVLLVGGSSWMPAVTSALKGKGWDPKLVDPDLAIAKGAALYAAGRTVRYLDREAASADGDGTGVDPGAGLRPPVTDDAVRTLSERTGISQDDLRRITKREVINVLPKAIGMTLIDTTKPGWEDDMEGASYVAHLLDPQTALPHKAETFVARTISAGQSGIRIEFREQAGASPSREMSANTPIDNGDHSITGLEGFALPVGSPVHVDVSVDEEGTMAVQALEPVSNKLLEFSVRISILSAEQVIEAKRAHAGLTIST